MCTEHVGMRSSLVFFEKEEEEEEEVGKPLFVYANEVSFSLSKSRNCLFFLGRPQAQQYPIQIGLSKKGLGLRDHCQV